jgi:ArsR family transcriptional regulator
MFKRVADHPGFAARAAEILKAVAHPVRLRIVDLLCREDLHVGALAERLDVAQPIVSQQLRILREQGLIASHRENGLVMNTLAEPELMKLLSCMENCLGCREVATRGQNHETSRVHQDRSRRTRRRNA